MPRPKGSKNKKPYPTKGKKKVVKEQVKVIGEAVKKSISNVKTIVEENREHAKNTFDAPIHDERGRFIKGNPGGLMASTKRRARIAQIKEQMADDFHTLYDKFVEMLFDPSRNKEEYKIAKEALELFRNFIFPTPRNPGVNLNDYGIKLSKLDTVEDVKKASEELVNKGREGVLSPVEVQEFQGNLTEHSKIIQVADHEPVIAALKLQGIGAK